MFKVSLEGQKEMQEALKEFRDDAFTKKVLTSAFRKAGKPFIKTAKAAAPVADRDVNQKGHIVKPQTLKKSIGNWVYRKDKSPHLMLGAKHGRRSMKFDGWYYKFIEFGTAKMAPKPFLQPSWDATKGMVSTILNGEFEGVLTKFKTKYGYK